VPWLAQAIDAHPDLTFLAGSDSLIFTGLEIGCSGLVSAVANVFPELVVDCYEAYDAGNEGRARELQSEIFRVRDAFKTGGAYMSGVKTALRMRDFRRRPTSEPAPAEGRRLRTGDALPARENRRFSEVDGGYRSDRVRTGSLNTSVRPLPSIEESSRVAQRSLTSRLESTWSVSASAFASLSLS